MSTRATVPGRSVARAENSGTVRLCRRFGAKSVAKVDRQNVRRVRQQHDSNSKERLFVWTEKWKFIQRPNCIKREKGGGSKGVKERRRN
jgi:hypothetical protein